MLRTVEAGRGKLQLGTLAVDMHPLEDTLQIHNNNNNINKKPHQKRYLAKMVYNLPKENQNPRTLSKSELNTYLEEEERQQEAAADCSNSSSLFFLLQSLFFLNRFLGFEIVIFFF